MSPGVLLESCHSMPSTRLFHPQHFDGILTGPPHYRLPYAPLSEYPEPWSSKVPGSERERGLASFGALKNTESQTWGEMVLGIRQPVVGRPCPNSIQVLGMEQPTQHPQSLNAIQPLRSHIWHINVTYFLVLFLISGRFPDNYSILLSFWVQPSPKLLVSFKLHPVLCKLD